MDENGLLRVITFTAGHQPFVVRCEQETKVKDIVQAIAESWGFRDAAPLFSLCKPSADCLPLTTEVTQLLRGASLLALHDRPCRVQAGRDKDCPPLLLVRTVFGGASSAMEQNQAVLTLSAAQVAADMTIGRYPPQADGNLLNHIVQQGQPQVVMQLASQWQSGKQSLSAGTSVVATPIYVEQLSAFFYLCCQLWCMARLHHLILESCPSAVFAIAAFVYAFLQAPASSLVLRKSCQVDRSCNCHQLSTWA